MGTNVSAISAATKQNILLGILEKGTSKNAVAAKAGIPSTTFDRKLKNAGTFTVEEIGQIAEALGLHLDDLLRSAA
jgi:DNA-binding phage protein